ncbi:diguanylate cyclase [Dechloromonas sp. A34]|uniref:sensor domain-containing diguanylate cyclase n=1 Tax=Dechloromonas sp. A34 TaxID=447588 RepID=UPI002248C6CD|nr:diguanylate cyclase [Dechloromonas sp. A34]
MTILKHLRVRYLIMIVVGLSVTAGLVVTAAIYTQNQEAAVREQNERAMEKLTESVLQGLQSVMLAGSADMAQAFAKHLKEVPDISELRVLRRSGEEAFLDNQTIDEVNRRRGEEVFPPHEQETAVRILPADDANLQKVLAEGKAVSVYRPDPAGNQTLTFLAPIKNQDGCYKCHGKTHPMRGVLLLETSLAEVEKEILLVRQKTLLLLAASLMVTMLLSGYLMGRAVVAPIETVTRAMSRVRQGDLEHHVTVDSRDELGRMADSFNLMTAGVKSAYSGLKREHDKLTTIILGASEGIAVADAEGRVALVNPAMEKLVGKTSEQIVAGGLEQLLDDPATMGRWLAGGGTGEIPTAVYRGHTFQVFAATLQADDGRPAGAAVLLRDITAEQRLEQELRRLSTTDALTGLYNRRHLDATLSREFDRTARAGNPPLSIIMIDIDHFKKFNDTHGHDQGDRVLKAVALCMRNSLRQHDVACRYGGEEFLAILPNTPGEGVGVVAERLRRTVEDMVVDGLKVTISLGTATFPELPSESSERLVEAADGALYRSKENGRNRVTAATAEMLKS